MGNLPKLESPELVALRDHYEWTLTQLRGKFIAELELLARMQRTLLDAATATTPAMNVVVSRAEFMREKLDLLLRDLRAQEEQ